MDNKNIDVLIIGAGPAGVAAGIGAKKEGAKMSSSLKEIGTWAEFYSSAYIRASGLEFSEKN